MSPFSDVAKNVYGLEHPDDQLAHFQRLPCELQSKMLLQANANGANEQTLRAYVRLLRAYDGADRYALSRAFEGLYIDDVCQCRTVVHKLLFENRNVSFANRLVHVLSANSDLKRKRKILVIVGIGHLLGAGSFQDALKEHGFKAGMLHKLGDL